jgi:hypothetical protein
MYRMESGSDVEIDRAKQALGGKKAGNVRSNVGGSGERKAA